MSLVWVKCWSLPASTPAFYTLEHPQIRTSAFYPRPQTRTSGYSIYCISPSAHRPTVVLNTARDLLDTNQTHQRVVLHNLTQVVTCCCPVKTHVDGEQVLNRWKTHTENMYSQPEDQLYRRRFLHMRTEDEPTPLVEEVREAMKKLKNQKSPGCDRIPAELWKAREKVESD